MACQPPQLSREELIQYARELQDIVGAWFPGRPGQDSPKYFLAAAGFLARSRTLLSGIATLVENSDDDCVGALYRPLLETYLSGMFSLLGEDSAMDVLESALKFQTHQIEVALGESTTKDPPPNARRLPVSHRPSGKGLVEHVDRLLSAIHEDYANWAPRAHDHHYRVTSLYDAHGGLGCLFQYLDEDGQPIVRRERGDPDKALYLLDMAISLVLGLAAAWATQAGKDKFTLIGLYDRWSDRPGGANSPA